MTRLSFDRNSGLVFTEFEVHLQAPEIQPAGLRLPDEDCRSRVGPRSLRELALRQSVRYIEFLTPEVLTSTPWFLAERIWDMAEGANLTSLRSWQSFASTYSTQSAFSYRAVAHLRPLKKLSSYVEDLSWPSFHHLTSLTISGFSLSRTELFSLTRLPNLVALNVSGTRVDGSDYLIDDNVVRNWARLSQQTPAFSRLAVLLLRKQRSITAACMPHLALFPKLQVWGFRDCAISGEDARAAQQTDWEPLGSEAMSLPSASWDALLRGCLKLATPTYPVDRAAFGSAEPLLNLRLGPLTRDDVDCNELQLFRRTFSAPPYQSQGSKGKGEQPPSDTSVKRRKIRAGKSIDIATLL